MKRRICERPGCGKSFVSQRAGKFCSPYCRKKNHEESGISGASVVETALEQLVGGHRPARATGAPRECRCNGKHVLRVDQDGDYGCFACGGSIDGEAIFSRIARARATGADPEAIAEALNVEGVPMVNGAGWTADAVLQVLSTGHYLPRVPPEPDSLRLEGGLGEHPDEDPYRRNHKKQQFPDRVGRGVSSEIKVYRGEPGKPAGPVEVRPASSFERGDKS